MTHADHEYETPVKRTRATSNRRLAADCRARKEGCFPRPIRQREPLKSDALQLLDSRLREVMSMSVMNLLYFGIGIPGLGFDQELANEVERSCRGTFCFWPILGSWPTSPRIQGPSS